VLLIFITAIVVAIFNAKYADQKVNWTLIVKKSNNWIKKESSNSKIPEDFDWDKMASSILSEYSM